MRIRMQRCIQGLPIDDDKLARGARLVFHIGLAIATDPEAPTWTEKGRAEVGAMTRR